MISDRVGDFIVRLQNAAMINKEKISVPYSAHLSNIAKKLKQLGFLESVEVKGDMKKTLDVTLAFGENGEPKIRGVKRVSKPGRRLYTKHGEAHRVKGGTGARVLSTSAGILSDSEARKSRLGGEDLFVIW